MYPWSGQLKSRPSKPKSFGQARFMPKQKILRFPSSHIWNWIFFSTN